MRLTLLSRITVLGLFVLSGTAAGQTQAAVAEMLKHQEGLVRSMQCEFDSVMLPISPAMVALLKKATQGNPKQFHSYNTTATMAEANSFTAKWWRQGDKER